MKAVHGRLAADRDRLLKTITQASGKRLPNGADEFAKFAQSKGMPPEVLLMKMASALATASRGIDE